MNADTMSTIFLGIIFGVPVIASAIVMIIKAAKGEE